MAIKLTAAELRLLDDLCDRPVRRGEEDLRRPFYSLMEKKLIRHNATVGKHERAFWAPTATGRALIEG